MASVKPASAHRPGPWAQVLETEVVIDAEPAAVWRLLTEFERMGEWNPFIRSIRGRPRAGQALEVEIAPPGAKPMRFRPTVLVAEAGRELRWRGRLGVGGVFDGEHYFRLSSEAPGRTRFVHGERFTGIAVPLLLAGKAPDRIRQGFAAMNASLKQRAEKG